MNALFVCSQNRLRSPTAERVFFGTPGVSVRSAGTERDADNPVSKDDLEWAEIVFVMEKRHREKLQTMFKGLSNVKRIVCLGIPDEYDFMQPELIKLLKQKVTPYLLSAINTATVSV
jgi:predicted protein tyrosine phosphatase